MRAGSKAAPRSTAGQSTSARDFIPQAVTLPTLREAARSCKGCPLWKSATQTVFGEGRSRARLMFVGEQPGDEEDRKGHPFVGPAGRLFDKALQNAGIDRADAYVTNVVKHFKFELQGQRRLHKKPAGHEIRACVPWLHEEIALVRPHVLVCLGATAAQALLGPSFRVSQQRGREVTSELAPHVLSTVHPSSILRARSSEDRGRELEQLVEDLRVVAALLAS